MKTNTNKMLNHNIAVPILAFLKNFRILVVRSRTCFWNTRALIRYKLKDGRQIRPVFPLTVHAINLAMRTDRFAGLKRNLEPLDIFKIKHFVAIEHTPGGVGCAISHLKILLENINQPFYCVIEDDFRFSCSGADIKNVINEFFANPSLDILCIGNNQVRDNLGISSNLAITTGSQTASMYIAKSSAYMHLKNSFLRSLSGYINGEPYAKYAFDQQWKREQERCLVFSVPKEKMGAQEEGFSDIEKIVVNYKS